MCAQGPISKWNGPKPAAGSGSDLDAEELDPFEPALDTEAAAQAHINALAGACLALGIKFAGTGDDRARALLHNYVLYFLSAKQRAPDPVSGGQQQHPTPGAPWPGNTQVLLLHAVCGSSPHLLLHPA